MSTTKRVCRLAHLSSSGCGSLQLLLDNPAQRGGCVGTFNLLELLQLLMGLNDRNGKTYRPINHQRGKSIDYIDMARTALPPGMRISKNGKPYHESRRNRTDLHGVL
jgi:hypothetical protein